MPHCLSGLGWRPEIASAILDHAGEIDCVEVITEHFLGDAGRLAPLTERFTVIPHGIELSIGTDEPLDAAYLDALAALVEATGAPWCSDHLCYTRTSTYALGNLTPLTRTRAAAARIAEKAAQVQRAVGVPFLLENITLTFMPAGELTEAEFLAEVVERSGCGLLLDVTNLAINAANHGYDPVAFLDEIPVEAVRQVHLAGGHREGDRLVDSHSHAVEEDVWALFGALLDRTAPGAVVLERDQRLDVDFAELLADVRRARELTAGVTV
jgi:hypothetical protein